MAKSAKKKRVTVAPAVQSPVVKKAKRAVAPVVAGQAAKLSKARAKKRVSDKPKKPAPSAVPEVSDRLTRLLAAVMAVGAGKKKSPRTQKLLNSGVPKMAQKLVEEAAEVAIDAVRGVRAGIINESADLLFNLVVLWSAVDLTPADIWAEMDRREATLGMAEKLPKPLDSGDI